MAAAVRLATRGFDVTVVEQRDKPGGRAYVYEQDGFRFDGGPTVITAPWLIDELFTGAGRNPAAYYELRRLDPFYRIFFSDGKSFDYSGDRERMLAEIRRTSLFPGDTIGYEQLTAMSAQIFDKGFTELATQPFQHMLDMARIVPDMIRLQSYRSVYGLVSRYVEDERLRQIFSFHPLLVGGNPFDTTSIYALIQHLEREWGVWFAMGGTGAIVGALVKLLEELGGRILFGAPVERIDIERGRATGVKLTGGRIIPADIVVSNADIATTWRQLVPESVERSLQTRLLDHKQYSMSLVVIYFGTRRTYRNDQANRLAHHNIILGPRYEKLLRDIFHRKILAEDFSLYLHMPTLTDPSLAPPGHEAFYVLAPVPHLEGSTDWAVEAPRYRDRIMAFLEEHYLPGLSESLVTERMIDPRHFRDVLGSHLGSAFSFQPTLTQSAWFRQHNRSDEIENLYFVGAGTHPGAGVPGVLCSAKILDALVDDRRSGAHASQPSVS
ncbi:MAG: phytoene desaturase [Thermomicrobiales bacterium]|nr:phytoene desaturase [Thermomicrobiales bacterium]